MGKNPQKSRIKEVVENIKNLDIGIDAKVSFGHEQASGVEQGLLYDLFEKGRFVPFRDWNRWRK